MIPAFRPTMPSTDARPPISWVTAVGIASALSLGLLLSLGGTALAQVEYLGAARVSGELRDRSGLEGLLETGTPANVFGGLSAIEYTGEKNRYLVLSDRGPGDGAASFPCRFHTVELALQPARGTIDFQLLETTLLKDPRGNPMLGNSAPIQSWNGRGQAPSLDSEGIRVLDAERLLISDEYGPSMNLFSRDGRWVESIPLPEPFGLSERRLTPWEFGTFTNRGMEGVAVTPDGGWIVGAMQGPLVQDGRIENNKCFGIGTRWFAYRRDDGASVQWVYPLEDESTGVSEVLALDAKRFLVLERDSLSGDQARIKRIYVADATRASDVSEVASLRGGLPADARTLDKQLLIDLLQPEFGLHGTSAPEKPEGLAWGPRLEDGRRLLLVCFDNDFEAARETIFVAFAVPEPVGRSQPNR